MIHIKDKNLNYKLKLEKLNNPKFKQKVKKNAEYFKKEWGTGFSRKIQ